MDYFLEQLHVLLPAIGIDLFRGVPAPAVDLDGALLRGAGESPIFFLRGKKHVIEARAQLIDGEFIVLVGSTAAGQVSESEKYGESTIRAYANFRAIRTSLAEKDMLVVEGTIARFVKDVPFSSPSIAGAIVLGRSCNGRTSWVTEAGVPFGAWEGRDLVTVVEGPRPGH